MTPETFPAARFFILLGAISLIMPFVFLISARLSSVKILMPIIITGLFFIVSLIILILIPNSEITLPIGITNIMMGSSLSGLLLYLIKPK